MAGESLSHPQPANWRFEDEFFSISNIGKIYLPNFHLAYRFCSGTIFNLQRLKFMIHLTWEIIMASTSKRNGKTNSTSKDSKSSRPNKAVPFYSDVIGLAGTLLHSTQESGAEKISNFAEATRNFADDFEKIPNIRNYVTAAADQMDTLSEYVTESTLEEMMSDASDFAKRNPVATTALAIALGFGLTRIISNIDSVNEVNSSKRRYVKARTATSTSKRRSPSPNNSKANERGHAESASNAA
jgi:hypothetical protein